VAIIRPARSSDADAIWRVFQQIVAAGDSYVFAAETSRADAEEYFLGRGIPTFVSEIDGQVAGFYKLIPNRRDRGAHVANASFMVDPALSGHGIGRALGDHCLREARRRGYESMQFNFVVGANTRAVALWQGLGFAIVATLPRVFRHASLGDIDAHVMFRSLADLPTGDTPTFGHAAEGVSPKRRPSAYALVENDSGLVAIVTTSEGVFLPGGGIDPGEWAELTAVREAREECAIDVRTTWLIGRATDVVFSKKEGDWFEKTSMFLVADLIGPVAAAPEHAVRWLPLDDAARAVTRDGHAWAIRQWQTQRHAGQVGQVGPAYAAKGRSGEVSP
jgi:L-amino acid N-acyltransferase YncA/8-oxo-dGTP pyrophosphatase MutT (NUDIX family)